MNQSPEQSADGSAYRVRSVPRSKSWLAAGAMSLTLALAACGGGSKPAQSNTHPAGGASTAGSNTLVNPGGPMKTSTQGGSSTQAPPNGVAQKSPQAAVSSAVQAIDQVHSVHVAGSVVDGGIPVRMDLQLVAGRGGQGMVSENGLGFRLIALDKVLYIQGSDAFWSHFAGATAARVFHGKWLKAPNAGQFASVGALTSISGLFGRLLNQHGALSRGHRTTIGGRPALGITDRSRGGTLYVATTGTPYPLEIVKAGSNGGYVTFTGFDQPVALTAPARSIKFPSAG